MSGSEVEAPMCWVCGESGPTCFFQRHEVHAHCRSGWRACYRAVGDNKKEKEKLDTLKNEDPQAFKQNILPWVQKPGSQTNPRPQLRRDLAQELRQEYEEDYADSFDEEETPKLKLNETRFISYVGFWDRVKPDEAAQRFREAMASYTSNHAPPRTTPLPHWLLGPTPPRAPPPRTPQHPCKKSE
eukprot:614525-Pyramimonas_sp.AAC.1